MCQRPIIKDDQEQEDSILKIDYEFTAVKEYEHCGEL